jgi:hypothetical protein
MKKAHEAIRIEPINVWRGTAVGGGAIGSTIGGGAVDISKGIGDFTILVGAHSYPSTADTWATSLQSGTGVSNIHFAVYEATAATHAGSAISGATISLGAATAGTLRGLYDAFIAVGDQLATTVKLTINGIAYHQTATYTGGTLAAAGLAGIINGQSTEPGHQKLPHYKADVGPTGTSFGASGIIYLHPDDDQATGLTIVMDAVTDTAVPHWSKLQGKISINGHALSTNTPKWLSVRNATLAGSTAVAVYSFLLRDGAATPGALVALNT